MVLKKIHHLIRYFFLLGVVSFAGYVNHLQEDIFLLLTSPCLYIAHAIFSAVSPKLIKLPSSDTVHYYVFLLPVCLIYYTLIGFQLKQLVNERSKIKWPILIIFVGFVLYVHYVAFKKLSGYIVVSDF